MNTNWQIQIIEKGYKYEREVFIYRLLPNGTQILGDERVYPPGEVLGKPTLELSPEQLQAFADALSKVGYKPQRGFVEGKLEATEKHLEDMRDLVFKKSN